MIVAIVVGTILDSWGWGIATFFILMFIFIWVASWIFGGPIKAKVEVNDELEELLNKLESIGTIKNALPFNARGWCNSFGLYVQLREMANMTRLQAGGKHKSQIDAWQDYLESGTEWKVKKYNPGDWEKLVDPTLEIANWLSTYGGPTEEYADSLNRAVEVFKKEGHLELHDVKKAGITRGVANDKAGVKKSSNITKARTKIEEYDQELLDDIQGLQKRVNEAEDTAKEFMQAYGTPEKTINEVVRKAQNEDRPISLDSTSAVVSPISNFLREMASIYRSFYFRCWISKDIFQLGETNIVTSDGWYLFNTCSLNDDERREYAKQWEATRKRNYSFTPIPVYKGYPTLELMRFVGNMLKKYGTGSVLTEDEYIDANMKAAWEAWDEDKA